MGAAAKDFEYWLVTGGLIGNMKGYLSRFYNDTPQPFFRERVLSGPRTRIPHWEICRPDIRRDLDEGDMVFFFSDGETTTGWSDSVCRGVIVVSARVEEAAAGHELGPAWRRWHRRARCAHHKSSRYDRSNDIILGDKRRSLWLDHGIDLRRPEYDSLRRAGRLGRQRNLWMSERDCARLYRRLRRLKASAIPKEGNTGQLDGRTPSSRSGRSPPDCSSESCVGGAR